jgi:hypothetical protein
MKVRRTEVPHWLKNIGLLLTLKKMKILSP